MKTNGKIFIVIAGFILMLNLFSCQQKAKVDEQEQKMSTVFKIIKGRSDSLEKIYLATIDQIDSSLNEIIREKQGVTISGQNSSIENRRTSKDQILKNIKLINNLLEANKATIASLEKNLQQYKQYKAGFDELTISLKAEKEKNETLEKQITVMKLALTEKDFTIAELNGTILSKDTSIQVLTTKNKEQVIALNKTYFTSGTYKQLKEKKIVEKEGGVLGMTSAKVVSGNLDKKDFTDLDMLKDTTIQLTGKDPKIITTHPEGTYKLEVKSKELSVLTINDPVDFWKVSKYLIVEVR